MDYALLFIIDQVVMHSTIFFLESVPISILMYSQRTRPISILLPKERLMLTRQNCEICVLVSVSRV